MKDTFSHYIGTQSYVEMFLKEIKGVCNAWLNMYQQGGCRHLYRLHDQRIVVNSMERKRTMCCVLYWL
jgi:hypothetical protein